MAGEVRKLLVWGSWNLARGQLQRHLERALPAGVEVATSMRDLTGRLRATGDDTRGVYVVRNVVSHVAQAQLRGKEDVAQVVGRWNDQLRAAAVLVGEGRLMVVSFEQLFVRRTRWDRLSRFLGLPLESPAQPAEVRPDSLDAPVLEEITRTAALDVYRAVLDDTTPPITRQRRQVVRMYHEDEAAYDYDYQDVGARLALRRTLGQDVPEEPDVVCIGSAAVFGRFSADPFPQIVARETGLKVANLGFGGVRPEAYLTDPVLMRLIERARIVVVELMSGRGYANDMLAAVSPLFNAVTIKPAYVDVLNIPATAEALFVDRPWDRAFVALPPEETAVLVSQSARRLEDDLAALIARSRSAIVFHLAQEPLPPAIDRSTYRFPHLVTQDLAARLAKGRPFCSVVSKAGVPSKIVNRFTGEPEALMPGWPDPTVNAYYPSPEMHREAATALLPLLAGL